MAHQQLRTLRRLFLLLLGLAAVQVCLIIWLMPGQQVNTQPPPAPQHHRYITVEFTSQRRLGNLLFDYAALLGIAQMHNFTAIMPTYFPALDVFELKVKLVDDVFQQLGMWSRFREWKASQYDGRVENGLPKPPSNVVLNGFYQSWKYFAHIEKELRTHLSFKPHIEAKARQFLQDVSVGDVSSFTRVGIHVRRGDILTADDIIRKGYTTPDVQYYHKAMQHFRSSEQQVQFIVVTDSLDWSRSHLTGDGVVFSPGLSPAVDLAILALCDHVIMSVGTFGWWGAWLAGGTTIYYDQWPKKGSYLAYQVNPKDYFPPHWIPMH